MKEIYTDLETKKEQPKTFEEFFKRLGITPEIEKDAEGNIISYKFKATRKQEEIK